MLKFGDQPKAGTPYVETIEDGQREFRSDPVVKKILRLFRKEIKDKFVGVY